MILGFAAHFRGRDAKLVSETGIQLFSVDYRLAPEFPHPTPVNDVYAGLQWVREHDAEFKIDPTRIAVMGESAGGGLAASVTLMDRDKQASPPHEKQILIYIMVDDTNIVPNPLIKPFAHSTNEANTTASGALLGDKFSTDEVSPYAAPIRAKCLDGLPPTHVDIGELDIIKFETLKHASRIAAANVSVEFHLYPGIYHSFEMSPPKIAVARQACENRWSFIRGL